MATIIDIQGADVSAEYASAAIVASGQPVSALLEAIAVCDANPVRETPGGNKVGGTLRFVAPGFLVVTEGRIEPGTFAELGDD